jgi:hypothetical protein
MYHELNQIDGFIYFEDFVIDDTIQKHLFPIFISIFYMVFIFVFYPQVFGSPSTPILENPEHQTRWYFKYFLGKCMSHWINLDETEKKNHFLCPFFF